MSVTPTAGFLVYVQDIFDNVSGVDYVNLRGVPFGGGTPFAITTASADGDERTLPALSPDSTQIAYLNVDAFGNNSLAVCNADGSNQTVIDGPLANRILAIQWHPDGTKILYQVRSFPTGTLFMIAPDGTGKTSILSAASLERPDYNSDGSKITYVRNPPLPALTDLWVANGDGSGATMIVADTSKTPYHVFLNTANVIVYGKAAQLRRINADGTGDSRIDAGGYPGTPFFWRLGVADDDSFLFFVAARSPGTWEVWRIDPNSVGSESNLSLSVFKNVNRSGPVYADSRVYAIAAATPQDLVSVEPDGSDLRVEEIPSNGPDIFESDILGPGNQ